MSALREAALEALVLALFAAGGCWSHCLSFACRRYALVAKQLYLPRNL